MTHITYMQHTVRQRKPNELGFIDAITGIITASYIIPARALFQAVHRVVSFTGAVMLRTSAHQSQRKGIDSGCRNRKEPSLRDKLFGSLPILVPLSYAWTAVSTVLYSSHTVCTPQWTFDNNGSASLLNCRWLQETAFGYASLRSSNILSRSASPGQGGFARWAMVHFIRRSISFLTHHIAVMVNVLPCLLCKRLLRQWQATGPPRSAAVDRL